MRVARSYAPGDVRIEDAEDPEPGPGEVVCEVLACGVCASDVTDWYVAARLPAVLGHELVGTIRAVGAGASAPPSGTTVAIHHHTPCGECRRCRRGHETLCERFRATRLDPGGFAERVRISQELTAELLEIPEHLDPITATFIEPLGCVLRAQDRAGLHAGDALLVVGAGVNGLLQIAAAHARGVEAVWVREPRPERLELAEAWGAEHHGNELVDVAIVCTPKPDAIAAAAAATAPGGTLCLYAPPATGRAPAARRQRRVPARADDHRELLGRPRRHARRARADRQPSGRSAAARLAPPAARRDGQGPRAPAQRHRAEGGRGAVRAALLYGPEDLRVEAVPDPVGEVIVEVEAATTCGTDVKMWRHGHRILPPYPCAFGHETAGVRADTGRRVLVSDSVACGACAPCRAGRAQICRSPTWVLGGFAEYIAAPEAALHAVPDGLPAHAAAMAEPLAAAVHAVDRGSQATDVGILGGGPMGLMLAALLIAEGRSVTLADPHPERRAQAAELGAKAATRLSATRAGLRGRRPARGLARRRGGRRAGRRRRTRRRLPPGQRGHPRSGAAALRGARAARDVPPRAGRRGSRAGARWPTAVIPWPALQGPTISLNDLPKALATPNGGPALKWVVDPRR